MLKQGYYNIDCLEAMKEFPDNFFDLAVVDPPYGGAGNEWEQKKRSRFGGLFEKYEIKAERTGGTWAEKYGKQIEHWDIAPGQEYFDELFRVSKNQIIWGGNYFDLPPTRCFLVWRKLTISEKFSMAMCEYAWTSFNDNAKFIEIAPQGQKEKRFHPTQKPKKLYEWIVSMYTKTGCKILDTHVGSANSLCVYEKARLDYWGFEINKSYYEKGVEQLEIQRNQLSFL